MVADESVIADLNESGSNKFLLIIRMKTWHPLFGKRNMGMVNER